MLRLHRRELRAYLLETDPAIEITNLDALTYAGNPDNLAGISTTSPRYRFVQGDIADRPLVIKLVADGGFDAIVNFAAESHVDRSISDATPFLRTNILGTQCLLDAARAAKVPRYVQVSTDEVYGTLGPDDPAFSETDPAGAEQPLCRQQGRRRPPGPRRPPHVRTRYRHHPLLEQLRPVPVPREADPAVHHQRDGGIPVPVYGDGRQVRDWIHVLDHCRGIDAALRRGRAGEVYNFGGESERYNIDVTRAILKLCGKTETLIRYVTDRLGHDRRYAINCTKAEAELGWRPTVAFEEGLAATVAWYQAHSDWVERVRSGAYRQ